MAIAKYWDYKILKPTYFPIWEEALIVVQRVVIHYDNGTKYDVRDIKTTNATTVIVSNREFLHYEKNTPEEVGDGVYQLPKYAVDTFDVIGLEIYMSNGEKVIREFR